MTWSHETVAQTASNAGRIDRSLRVSPAWIITPDEFDWRFSRSSGPGGQGVNTSDSRVELTWYPLQSPSLAHLPDHLKSRVLERLGATLVNGAVVIAVSEHRAQLRNRETARLRLQHMLRSALAAPPATRRPSRPTRASIERRLAGKKARSDLKARRARPPID